MPAARGERVPTGVARRGQGSSAGLGVNAVCLAFSPGPVLGKRRPCADCRRKTSG